MADLMSSNESDYQSLLINAFDTFLQSEKASDKTRTNYKSDVRHFLNFFSASLPAEIVTLLDKPESILTHLKDRHIEDYKIQETGIGTPIATINRRLSSIRSFMKFALTQGWIINNPALNIANLRESIDEAPYYLNSYREFLKKQGKNDLVVTETINDINNYVTWLDASS